MSVPGIRQERQLIAPRSLPVAVALGPLALHASAQKQTIQIECAEEHHHPHGRAWPLSPLTLSPAFEVA